MFMHLQYRLAAAWRSVTVAGSRCARGQPSMLSIAASSAANSPPCSRRRSTYQSRSGRSAKELLRFSGRLCCSAAAAQDGEGSKAGGEEGQKGGGAPHQVCQEGRLPHCRLHRAHPQLWRPVMRACSKTAGASAASASSEACMTRRLAAFDKGCTCPPSRGAINN